MTPQRTDAPAIGAVGVAAADKGGHGRIQAKAAACGDQRGAASRARIGQHFVELLGAGRET
jgi:hypothetical protein